MSVVFYSNNHSVFSLHYHLVTKYRRRVINDVISDRLRNIFAYIGEYTRSPLNPGTR